MMQSQATSISNQIAISKRIGNTKLRFQQTQTISNDGWLLWRWKEISVELPEIVPETCLNPIWGLVDHWLLVLHGTRSWTIARNHGLLEDFPQLNHAESVLWRLTPGKRIMGYHRISCKTENWLYIKVLLLLSSHFNVLVLVLTSLRNMPAFQYILNNFHLPSSKFQCSNCISAGPYNWAAEQTRSRWAELTSRFTFIQINYFMNRFPLKRSSDKIYN